MDKPSKALIPPHLSSVARFEIESLNADHLDIEELEVRLEMALSILDLSLYCVSDGGCSSDCPSDCGANCPVNCTADCSTNCSVVCPTDCAAVCGANTCDVDCGVNLG
jgi:hypothetical protein